MQIHQHTFLVTGGSSGLGAASAREFIEAGGNVVVADIDDELGQTLANELGERCRYVHTDVTDATSVQKAVEAAFAHFEGLCGVVHCAGVGGAARIIGRDGPHSLDIFKRVVDVNLIGAFNVVRLSAAAMAVNQPNADGERGVLINTASTAAFEGQIGQAAYAASKGAVVAMTLPIARELARFGIRIVAIAPGVFETPMVTDLPAAALESLTSQVPFPQRLGHPAEFAALVRHVVENPMLNGCTIRLDGALRMTGR